MRAAAGSGSARRRTRPREIIDKLNKEINAIIADPAMKTRLVGLGIEPELMTPAQFGNLIADASVKWAKVIKFANITAE